MSDPDKLSFLNYWTEPHNYWRLLSDAAMFRIDEINIGSSSGNPELERRIVENTASYGRQLGWILEALVIIAQKLEQLEKVELSKEERDAFKLIYALQTMIDVQKKDAK